MFSSVLVVTFKNDQIKSKFLELYRVEAEYVRDHEMNTLSYEYAQSDKDPLQGILIERFISKDDYLVHKQSSIFISFREQLQRFQNEKLVTINGESFIDSNIGFIWNPCNVLEWSWNNLLHDSHNNHRLWRLETLVYTLNDVINLGVINSWLITVSWLLAIFHVQYEEASRYCRGCERTKKSAF